ncbi:MAG: hypothetical protein ACLQAH_15040 [Limisphaerales bacterium]
MKITQERTRLTIEASSIELTKIHTALIAFRILLAQPEHLYLQAIQEHLDGLTMWIESDSATLKQKIQDWSVYKNSPASPDQPPPLNESAN